MCEFLWDALAEIHLKKQDFQLENTCFCNRIFISTKELKQNALVEQNESEDVFLKDNASSLERSVSSLDRSMSIKNENDQESVSCYCSASHTDNLSTDEHDSLRDTHDISTVKNIKQSDSGADLTEIIKSDNNSDWHKFWSANGEKLIWQSWIEKYSAYINPDYLQHAQDVTGNEKHFLETIDELTSTKPTKFTFEDKEVQNFDNHKKEETKKSPLLRNLSGSDERLFTEVSEGWNPLSPASIDGETEAERLLSSRCGSYASGSLRTVDSMTNVTRMTVSSVELSNSTSSSDSFSSVSSVNSSISSEESEEDYQHQWNVLWRKNYEEEYWRQYNKFMKTISGGDSCVNSLGQVLHSLCMTHEKMDAYVSTDDEPKQEVAQMEAMGLPLAFGSTQTNKKKPIIVTKEEDNTSPLDLTTSFNAGRNKIRAAFNLLGIEFNEDPSQSMSGHVEYKIKHIRLQNRQLKMRPIAQKAKHVYFDDDGNVLPSNGEPDEESPHGLLSDDSENGLSSEDDDTLLNQLSKSKEPSEVPPVTKRKKRKKKFFLPAEIKENMKLRKYWHRRFSLFSKFDQGVKLDEESWYSVTPELVAKHIAERCRCDVIVDAFCGVGGNAIQFAFTCKRVIAIDIDPKKVEMAQNNAKVYGVANKIDFIIGDFLKLAEHLRADAVFLSPPWGGPSYLKQQTYDLETMLQPVPFSQLIAIARQISSNIAVFLPKNSNTYTLINEAGVGGKVEIEQDFLNNRLVSISVYYNQFIRQN